jgi:hypothetical protein
VNQAADGAKVRKVVATVRQLAAAPHLAQRQ